MRRLLSFPILSGLALAGLVIASVVAFSFQQQVVNLNREITTLKIEQANAAVSGQAQPAGVPAGLEEEIEKLLQERRDIEARLAQGAGQNILLQQEVSELKREVAHLEEQVASLTAGNITLAAQAVDLNRKQENLEKIIDLFSETGGQIVLLQGAGSQPEAAGRLLFHPNRDAAVLILTGLNPLGLDQLYQVVGYHNGVETRGQTFQVRSDGSRALIVQAPFSFGDYDRLAVSIEPAGGSSGPAGEIILTGEFADP